MFQGKSRGPDLAEEDGAKRMGLQNPYPAHAHIYIYIHVYTRIGACSYSLGAYPCFCCMAHVCMCEEWNGVT